MGVVLSLTLTKMDSEVETRRSCMFDDITITHSVETLMFTEDDIDGSAGMPTLDCDGETSSSDATPRYIRH